MQDIRWNAFWLLAALIVICLVSWVATDATTAMAIYSVTISIYLFTHLFWLHQLSKWVKKPEIKTIPNGYGIWEDVFAALYHEQRRHSRSKTQLSSALGRFRHAASALPDGVVVLNSDNKIEWCNPPAELQLGLDLIQDENQPIQYLVRDGDFLSYLISQDYIEPIKIRSWVNTALSPEHKTEITLEIQLVPFGTQQKLLICRDVTALEKIEAMRRDFIANVSHELRTPLTVVGGFLETLTDMEGAVLPNTRPYFAMMQEQTARMRGIIEDLLTLSQIESNAQRPNNDEIDMSQLSSMLHKEAQALSTSLSATLLDDEKQQQNITLEIESNLNILGSTDELHSAFSNLVSNAVRYTPTGGHIHISWHLEEKQGQQLAIFSVKDAGIGIEQQHIDRLTERFYRVDRSRSRATGGTGLGLSIVKHILNRHQAKLEIKSVLNEGSTFSAIFPKERIVQKQAALFE